MASVFTLLNFLHLMLLLFSIGLSFGLLTLFAVLLSEKVITNRQVFAWRMLQMVWHIIAVLWITHLLGWL